MKLDSTVSAVVTGAASGLGAATARALAARGVRVALFDLNEPAGKATAAAIGGLYITCDVTSERSVDAALTKARAAHGQEVYAFAPFNEEGRGHRWNPLSAVRTSELHRVGDLLTIGQVFFPNDGSGTSSEAFFNDQARNLFLGLGLLLLESPGLPRTVGAMLRQSSGKGRPLSAHLTALIASRIEAGRPFSHECTDALQRLLAPRWAAGACADRRGWATRPG